MKAFFRALMSAWTWRMAWRESRTRRRRLLLFASSIVLGIGALIAVDSFRIGVLRAIEEQARSLLGADLVLAGRTRFGPEEESLFRTIPGLQAREIDFSTMVQFQPNGGTRLVQVRALDGDFPFYGELESEPASGVSVWRTSGGALVEDSLLTQFGAKVGDEIKLGDLTLRVRGRLLRVPGDSVVFATLAPRVYVRTSDLAQTNLLRQGSMARYKAYFQLPPATPVEDLVKRIRPRMDQLRLGHTTVERRKEDLGDSLERLTNFLSLVGFVALFLGGVGVASAIHTHLKEKLGGMAILRCLGSTVTQTFAIYLAQAASLGVFASLAGAALGWLSQLWLPRVLGDFLSVRAEMSFDLWTLCRGFVLGLSFCVLFALLPLIEVRRVSPLVALRRALGTHEQIARGHGRTLVALLILTACTLFALRHTEKWYHGLGFIAGLLVSSAVLGGLARVLMYLARSFVPSFLPFPLRQGLSNLYRPNNRTSLLVLALGLGTFVLVTMYLTQTTLLHELISDSEGKRPNAIFFDIQPDQREAVAVVFREHQLPLLEEAPIVTMRLAKIRDTSVEDLLGRTNRNVARWALRREYRSTWRAQLVDSEALVAGQWHPPTNPATDVTPVSFEEGIAKDLGLVLGDQVTFDVQGVPLTTRVASLRRVDWRRIQPNFFVVFPPGVIESAPSFFVAVTRTSSSAQFAALQRAMVERFPNVSSVDLTLVLNTLDTVLKKISLALRFMALFTVATGMIVLAGAILVSRHQRLRESVTLRILGASAWQVRFVLLVEYASLGILSAISGILLAIAGTWALTHFIFKTGFVASSSLIPSVIALVVVSSLTVITGLLSSRGVLDQPPLEFLRNESE